MTQYWGRRGWHPLLLWPLPSPPGAASPSPVLCLAWGLVCTRICFLSHQPSSRCGLLGRASCVFEPDTCAAGCDKEPGLAGVDMGCQAAARCASDFEQAHGGTSDSSKSSFSARGTGQGVRPCPYSPSTFRLLALCWCLGEVEGPAASERLQGGSGPGPGPGQAGLCLFLGYCVSPLLHPLKTVRDQPPHTEQHPEGSTSPWELSASVQVATASGLPGHPAPAAVPHKHWAFSLQSQVTMKTEW